MSISVISLLKGCDIRPAAAKLVLVWMAEAASDDGSGIWKSADTLAEEASISRRSVFNAWEELEARGLIVRDGVKKNRGGSVTVWRIDLAALAALSTRPEKPKPRAQIAPGAKSAPRAKDNRNPVQNLHKPRAESAPKPLLNHQSNLTRDGADALARLLDAAASAPASGEEAERLALDVEGFVDGALIVGGRYSLERFSRSLAKPLKAAGLRLALQASENLIPLVRAC